MAVWLVTGIVWFFIYAGTFNYIIRKKDIVILGREKEGEVEEEGESFIGKMAGQSNTRVEGIIAALGGAHNVATVDNCMTRLRYPYMTSL